MKLLTTIYLCVTFLSLNAQWDRQHPFNHLGIINDIQLNDMHGAAVGDDATIFTTEDGGNSWTIRDNDLNGWNFATVERQGDIIYACGRGIYKSEDGGLSFAIVPNAPQEIFHSYLSTSGVLIVANNGGVFKSSDQGATFTSLNTPADSLGVTSFVYDEHHIWWATAGSNPVLYKTVDGGENWQAINELGRPLALAFFDDQIGIASSLPYIYYTEDGGEHWEQRGRLSRHFGKIIFGSSPDTAYLTSAKNFYSTYDGFNNFNEYNSVIPGSEVNGLCQDANGRLLLGASHSSVAESWDEGSSWKDITGKVKAHLTAMVSSDGQQVYAAGNKILLHTEDGGENWAMDDSIDIVPQNMVLLDEQTLILSGIQKILSKDLITKEETILYGPTPGIFEDFHVTPSGKWIAYSSRDYYIVSENQGMTWDSFYVEAFSNGLDMFNRGDLFLRVRGKLLFSNDEGESWKEIYTAEVARDISAISVVDSTIYIMESLRNLKKSEDYGLSWDSLPTPTGDPMIVNQIQFINQDTGYVYDSSGEKLWYTFDGGHTWPFSYNPKSRLNGIYSFVNEDARSLWLFGLGGFIEKQLDCKNPPLLSDIEGARFPCLFDTISYSVDGSNIDNYVWTIPDEWELVGSDNGSEIKIFAVEPGVGYLTVYGENACGDTDALEYQIAGTAVPEVDLIFSDNILSTDADGEQFQWFRNGEVIDSVDTHFYEPSEAGEYSVRVTFSTGCSMISNIVVYNLTSTDDSSLSALRIYPNPTNEAYIRLQSAFEIDVDNVRIIDLLGRNHSPVKIERGTREYLITLPDHLISGLYFLQIKDRNHSEPFIIQN